MRGAFHFSFAFNNIEYSDRVLSFVEDLGIRKTTFTPDLNCSDDRKNNDLISIGTKRKTQQICSEQKTENSSDTPSSTSILPDPLDATESSKSKSSCRKRKKGDKMMKIEYSSQNTNAAVQETNMLLSSDCFSMELPAAALPTISSSTILDIPHILMNNKTKIPELTGNDNTNYPAMRNSSNISDLTSSNFVSNSSIPSLSSIQSLSTSTSSPLESDEFSSPKFTRMLVSKVLLSGCSEYFKTIFRDGNSFAEEGQREVKISVAKGESKPCETLIKHIYNGCLPQFPDSFDAAQLIELIVMADRFVVSSVVASALRALNDCELTLGLCEMLLCLPESVTQTSDYDILKKKCGEKIVSLFRNFDHDCCLQDFLSLTPQALMFLIESDSIQLKAENTMWVAVREWLNSASSTKSSSNGIPSVGPGSGFIHKSSQSKFICGTDNNTAMFSSRERLIREKALPELFESMRLPRMDLPFLCDVVKASPWYEKSSRLRELVEDAIEFHAFGGQLGNRDWFIRHGPTEGHNGSFQHYSFGSGSAFFVSNNSKTDETERREKRYRRRAISFPSYACDFQIERNTIEALLPSGIILCHNFFAHGYFFYIKIERNDRDKICVGLHLDSKRSGIPDKRPFQVKLSWGVDFNLKTTFVSAHLFRDCDQHEELSKLTEVCSWNEAPYVNDGLYGQITNMSFDM